MNTDKSRLKFCYETALLTLAPLPRAVFLLCRVDDFSYREIGKRLSIEPSVVEDCIALTLVTFTMLWRGRPPDRLTPLMIAEAEAVLFQKYRGYCARVIATRMPVAHKTSNGSPGGQQDRNAIRSPRRWLPRIGHWSVGTLLQNRKSPTFPDAMTFNDWLRIQTGAENDCHDPHLARPLA